MVKTITLVEADEWFGDFDEYPNFSATGSVMGMKQKYGWDTKNTFRIGSYYYNLRGHPNLEAFKKWKGW